MLLGDLTNVSLRKRYLAARTPTLKEFDRFSAPKNPSFVEDVGRWVLCAVLGPPMLAAVLFAGGYLKSNGFHNPNSNLPPPSPGQVGELFGHFLFLGILVGLLLGLATLCIGGIVFLWKRARCGQLRNRWEELGPLPAGAPPDATEARKRFLGEA